MSRFNRRQFIRTSGLALTAGALMTACGDVETPTAAGRLGVAEPQEELPVTPPEIDDALVLRTVQSLHHTAIVALQGQLDGQHLSAEAAAIVEYSINEHDIASKFLSEIITELGAEPFECANQFIVDRFIDPTAAAVDDSDDPKRDAYNICVAFEEIVARSCQDMVDQLTDPLYRPVVLTMAALISRRAAALALLEAPAIADPVLLDMTPVETDEDGFPIRYPIPARFGQVTGFPLTVGKPDGEGARLSVNLTTPAANSYIYEDTVCP